MLTNTFKPLSRLDQSTSFNLFATSYVLFLATTIVLPFFSFPGYSIIQNTTSHLGAQASPNAVVMNAMFAVIAITAFLAMYRRYHHYTLHTLTLTSFTISTVLVGFFRHEPLITAEVNIAHANFHSFFATASGTLFTFLAIASIFIFEKKRDKFAAFLAGLLAAVLSIGMFSFPHIMGLLQRIIFLTSYGWMLYTAKNVKKTTK